MRFLFEGVNMDLESLSKVSDGLVDKLLKGALEVSRCLVPDFNGAIFSDKWKEALWDKFYTAAPQRHRQCVEQYKIVKRA